MKTFWKDLCFGGRLQEAKQPLWQLRMPPTLGPSTLCEPQPVLLVCPRVTTDRPALNTWCLPCLDSLWGQVPSGLGKVRPGQSCSMEPGSW